MNFYKTVCIVALVVLVISLAFIGTALASSSTNIEFPPNVSKCPDNYEIVYDDYGKFKTCRNSTLSDADCQKKKTLSSRILDAWYRTNKWCMCQKNLGERL